jgi:succinate dehydrogenase / fumarate reductase cytochrome b subunit
MAEVRTAAQRPLSPHLPVWRWHVTMWTSILHRATGVALYGGALILAGWVLCLALGEETYSEYMDLLGSPLGRIAMFGLTVALVYHLVNGVRHLAWDVGMGLSVKTANATGWFAIVFSAVVAVGLWVLAAFLGVL